VRNRSIIIAVVVGVAIIIFSGSIYRLILLPIAHGISWIVTAFIDVVLAIISGVVGSVIYVTGHVAGWAVAAMIDILSALIPVAAVFVVLLAIWAGLWIVIRQFALLSSKLDAISAEGKRAAIDTGFVAALATGAAGIAYVATDDFLEHFHTLKFLAVTSISCCVGKMSLLTPTRPAKFVGVVIVIFSVASSIFYLAFRFNEISWSAVDATRAFAFVVILTLLSAAAGYPFTIRGWRRMLSVS
jgi:hypothetical protein